MSEKIVFSKRGLKVGYYLNLFNDFHYWVTFHFKGLVVLRKTTSRKHKSVGTIKKMVDRKQTIKTVRSEY